MATTRTAKKLDLDTIRLGKGSHSDGSNELCGHPGNESCEFCDTATARRFWSKVRILDNGCWLWIAGADASGYGSFRLAGQSHRAHVLAFTLFGRHIPAGLVLDHTCHNTTADCPGGAACLHRRCVNPDHLEPVTRGVNLNRSPLVIPIGEWHIAKTHCPAGHPYAGDNLYLRKSGARACRECARLRARAAYQPATKGVSI